MFNHSYRDWSWDKHGTYNCDTRRIINQPVFDGEKTTHLWWIYGEFGILTTLNGIFMVNLWFIPHFFMVLTTLSDFEVFLSGVILQVTKSLQVSPLLRRLRTVDLSGDSPRLSFVYKLNPTVLPPTYSWLVLNISSYCMDTSMGMLPH